jgi:glycolate oxidase FAD binding subunit
VTAPVHATPLRVDEPDDLAGVCRAVAAAEQQAERVVASGAGRHLDVGAAARHAHALLRLRRLDRVLAYEPMDMTVTVESGCTLAALAHRLAEADQWLPLDPPCPEETTVGGMIAANLSGPLRASQGTVRDLLLGLAVVGAGGVLQRAGGRVVKNVAGYDLAKAHIGALGTLGVVVEATFKVKPRFAREGALAIEVPGPAAAAELAMALRDAIEPSWLELVHPASLLREGLAGSLVVAGMGGAPGWVEEAGERALGVAQGRSATRHDDGAALRRRLAALLVRPAAALLRIASLPTEVGSFVVPACEALRAAGCDVDLTAHAANGISRLAVARADQVERVLARLRASAPAGAIVVVERAPPAVKADLDVWGGAGAAASLMAGLQRALDPAGTFAAGRFVTDA